MIRKTRVHDYAIGDAVQGGYWRAPEFYRSQRAFYYVRVLEIPTTRWTTYDAKVFGVKRPEDVPASMQERAYENYANASGWGRRWQ